MGGQNRRNRKGADSGKGKLECDEVLIKIGECFSSLGDRFGGVGRRLLRYNYLPGFDFSRYNKIRGDEVKRLRRASHFVRSRAWDTIDSFPSPSCVPKDATFVVVAVKTHDDLVGRIVEMAWIAYDSQYAEVTRYNCLLKPHRYESTPEQGRKIHGISTELAYQYGSETRFVFAHFVRTMQRVPPNGYVIAYKMNHEDPVIRENLDLEGQNVWDRVPKCDTFITFGLAGRNFGLRLVDYYKRIRPHAYGFRRPTQSALAGCRMTWDVFTFLVAEIKKRKHCIRWKDVLRWKPSR